MSGADAVDHAIIEILSQDARVSNRQIAAAIGVTEGTVRTRIRRLQDDRLIRFTLVRDFRMAGSPNLVMYRIWADVSQVREVATELKKIPEIGCVAIMMARYNLLATGLFTNAEAIYEVAHNKMLAIPAVHDVNVSIALYTLKYDVRKARTAVPDAEKTPALEARIA